MDILSYEKTCISSKIDVGQALEESNVATVQIESMKSDKSEKFEEIYQESFAFSTEHGFDKPTETPRKRRGDIQENDQTCKSRVQGLYDELLSIFIDEIRSRFSNDSYRPAIELFEIIRLQMGRAFRSVQ